MPDREILLGAVELDADSFVLGVEWIEGIRNPYNHSIALSKLDAEDEGDITWGGAGIAWSF